MYKTVSTRIAYLHYLDILAAPFIANKKIFLLKGVASYDEHVKPLGKKKQIILKHSFST